MGAQWRALWPRLLLSRASEAYDRARFVRTMEGRNLAGTRFTAIDPRHWTITRETTKLGEVTPSTRTAATGCPRHRAVCFSRMTWTASPRLYARSVTRML